CAVHVGQQTGGGGGRSQELASVAAYRRTGSAGLFQRRGVAGHRAWRPGCDRRRACAAARAEGSPAWQAIITGLAAIMTSFNLAAWAITHRPLGHYFMAMLDVI